MQLGDARSGKMADNIVGFGRTLRRAGVPTDAARISLATEAALLVGLGQKQDLSAALEAVMVSREQDRLVFRELFGHERQPLTMPVGVSVTVLCVFQRPVSSQQAVVPAFAQRRRQGRTV